MKNISSEAVAIVFPKHYTESLCSSCFYNGNVNCPERQQLSSFRKEDYPFINKYRICGINLLVDGCDYYKNRRMMVKQNVKRSEYVFNSRTRSFEKAK